MNFSVPSESTLEICCLNSAGQLPPWGRAYYVLGCPRQHSASYLIFNLLKMRSVAQEPKVNLINTTTTQQHGYHTLVYNNTAFTRAFSHSMVRNGTTRNGNIGPCEPYRTVLYRTVPHGHIYCARKTALAQYGTTRTLSAYYIHA